MLDANYTSIATAYNLYGGDPSVAMAITRMNADGTERMRAAQCVTKAYIAARDNTGCVTDSPDHMAWSILRERNRLIIQSCDDCLERDIRQFYLQAAVLLHRDRRPDAIRILHEADYLERRLLFLRKDPDDTSELYPHSGRPRMALPGRRIDTPHGQAAGGHDIESVEAGRTAHRRRTGLLARWAQRTAPDTAASTPGVGRLAQLELFPETTGGTPQDIDAGVDKSE